MHTKQEMIQMIQRFSNANGVSGFEDEVVSLAQEYCPSQFTFHEDHLRNVYLKEKIEKQGKPYILIDAHSDEVGFIIQAIKPNGTMTFLPLGGWVPDTMPASKVRIKTMDGTYVSGIIAAKPPHFMKDREHPEALSSQEMVIDVGASSKQEVIERFHIGIGAPVVPDVICEYDEEKDLFLGKAFDCRIGCAAVIETLARAFSNEMNIIGTLSSQEEVGERGMNLVTKTISADIAICFEGCPADDTFQEEWMIQTALRKGGMLRHFDRSMITNPRFQRYALDLAKELNIPYQESVRSGGGTNGAMLHVSHNGIPTIVIGVPVRYIHSHHGFTTLEDFEHSVQLASAIVSRMNQDILSRF
ncbi:M42 family metallopeptidase [[Eubacterium] hominis]|uniref:M42 family metallopeptidase n=1 Tax=[Eubacterium] hominis TaxID=2764325 RepID=UPI003A4E0EB3